MIRSALIILWTVLALTTVANARTCVQPALCQNGVVELRDGWRIKPGAPSVEALDGFLREGEWTEIDLIKGWKGLGFPGRDFEATYHLSLDVTGSDLPLLMKPGYAHSNVRVFFRNRGEPFQLLYETVDEEGFKAYRSGHQITEMIELPFTGHQADILLQVSNGNYDDGGFDIVPWIGSKADLDYRQISSWLFSAVLLGCYILLAFYNLVFWLADRERFDHAALFVLSLVTAIRQFDTGRLLAAFAPESTVDWNWIIGWATLYLINICWMVIFAGLVNFYRHRYVLAPYTFLNIVGLILLLVAPGYLSVEYGKTFRPLIIFIAIYAGYFFFKTYRYEFRDKVYFIFGVVVLMTTAGTDVLLHEFEVDFMQRRVSDFGFMVFVFCLTIDFGRQYSLALRRERVMADELMRSNERLEQQVAMRTSDLTTANQRLAMLATTDDLTGLPNRRSFHTRLEAEMDRFDRYGQAVSLAVLDIDHFKRVNDEHGHDYGDEVLKVVATLLRNALRKSDYIARYGGEEFVVILPGTDLAQAALLLDRVRSTLKDNPIRVNGVQTRITISIGVAMARDCTDETELFRAADQALYQAKSRGRDRVICA